jgi:uncharacterized protein (TIGR02302 family)
LETDETAFTMSMRHDASENNRLNRLERAVLRAKAALAWESLWPRIVPALTVAGLFIALSWFGVWRVMPDMMRLAVLAVFALAFVYSLYRLLRIEMPDEEHAVHRVEVRSGLDHRPASGLRDTLSPVADDPAARALWTAHRKRLLEQMRDLRAGVPEPQMARRDPNAWRFAVPVLLAAAFFVANGEHVSRIGEAFSAVRAPVPAAASARVDAWIDPPGYTRQPPVFLTRQNAESALSGSEALRPSVPEHSVLTVRVVAKDAPRVSVLTDEGERIEIDPVEAESDARTAQADTETATPEPAAGQNAAAIHTFTTPLGQSGSVEISHSGGAQRHAFVVIDDLPPTIERSERNEQDVTRAGSFTLNFAVADDYGVVSGDIALALEKPPVEGARPLVELPKVPLRLSRPNAREGLARGYVRMGDHPFAGLDARVDATVVDGAGQEGSPQEPITVKLPQRSFINPIARALVEQRQKLAMDARDQRKVAQALDSMTIAPEEYLQHSSIYLGLRIGYKRLITASTDDELRDMLDYLWEMALQIEDGALSDAERRLNQARQALEDALERGASEEEIAKLTEELRQAMNEFLQSFAEEMARRDNQSLPQMQMDSSQMLSQQDLQEMLDRIEDLAKLGDRDSAQQLLSELQRMLDSLQMARRGQQMQNGQQSSEMMEQMEELGRLMREQQRLMDDTFGLDQGQRPRQRGQQGQQGQQGPMSPSELAELLKQLQQGQSDLHEGLQALMDQLQQGEQGQPGQQGNQPGQQGSQSGQRALDRAGRAMGDATRSLGQGQTGDAFGSQGEALQAMREGMEGMMQQMFGNQGQQQAGRGRPRGRTDPLGRPQRTEGPDFGQDVRVPDEIDVQRAREILNAIRERLGERYRPRYELDYLERLLRND